MTRPFTALVCLILAAGGGCEVRSKLFCDKNPNDPRCGGTGGDGAIDSPSTLCQSSTQCAAFPQTPECDTDNGSCVQCFMDSTVCPIATPTCGSNDKCRACETNLDCVSNACLDDGTCAPTDMVAYVSPDGSGSDCTQTSPCLDALTAIGTKRPFVRLIGSTTTHQLNIAQSFTFLGDQGSSTLAGLDPKTFQVGSGSLVIENTTLTSMNINGIAVNVANGLDPSVSVTIEECTLTVNGGGAVLADSGTVTISRSSIDFNGGGGLNLGVTTPIVFDVTNNFIYSNGTTIKSTLAGASLRPAPGSVFELNTLVGNQEHDPPIDKGAGVFCAGNTFTLDDNIIAASQAGSDVGSDANFDGDCDPGNSIIQAAIDDLKFADPNNNDYHLTSASTKLIDHALGSAIKIDFDGQVRPHGAASDIGADELYP